MAGTRQHLDKCWALLRGAITLSVPEPAIRMLGTNTRTFDRKGKDGQQIRMKQWEVKDFMVSCVDKYREVSGIGDKKLPTVGTPFLNMDSFKDEELTNPGQLGSVAAQVLMIILYGARAARWDLLKAICFLAGFITKWTIAHDRLLYRLICSRLVALRHDR